MIIILYTNVRGRVPSARRHDEAFEYLLKDNEPILKKQWFGTNAQKWEFTITDEEFLLYIMKFRNIGYD